VLVGCALQIHRLTVVARLRKHHRFLGCRIINSYALDDVFSVGRDQPPGPPAGEELIRWLGGCLVDALGPEILGSRPVRSPNKLVAFVNLAGYRYRSAAYTIHSSQQGADRSG